jgi:hypothetical protein
MPVPDNVIFGPDDLGAPITYGLVRKLPEDGKFRALQRRIDTYFVRQVDELGKTDEGTTKVYSPFPLFLMSCIGIETLGKAFFSRERQRNEQQEDIQREGFLEITKRLDQAFSRHLNKKQKAEYDELWGANSHKSLSSTGHILYRLGRHTMVHGYQGRGVFLSVNMDKWELQNGAMVINPYWLWTSFKTVNNSLWKQTYSNTEPTNPFKRSIRLYLSELLE